MQWGYWKEWPWANFIQSSYVLIRLGIPQGSILGLSIKKKCIRPNLKIGKIGNWWLLWKYILRPAGRPGGLCWDPERHGRVNVLRMTSNYKNYIYQTQGLNTASKCGMEYSYILMITIIYHTSITFVIKMVLFLFTGS